MICTAFFPGQGAQHPGMGQSLYENSAAAREVFDCASDIVGYSVSELCFHSEKEELSRTVNSQIAIFTCSMAGLAALRERGMQIDACAGFSLGEYTALAASGVLSLSDAIRLVQRRGELMQQAADSTDGCMAAVLGLDDATVEQICAQAEGIVLPVNYNCDGQLVVAGAREAVNAVAAACKEAGARRAVPLAVSGAFHTPMMAPAAAQLREFAQSLTFHAPEVPLYTNITGERLDVDSYPEYLERHMVSPVRWKHLALNLMADGHKNALEIGVGKTLTGFARRISRELTCRAVETMEDVIAVTE
ncbi:MAG TPA: ACP S-malonyltransferase [Candidatus Butyricicoccus stercorigallinarum]|nr:ACP S-malonyltransferase [Candidatus Butyricicoccus stercorigallinarum]